jgi:hypothetical protein
VIIKYYIVGHIYIYIHYFPEKQWVRCELLYWWLYIDKHIWSLGVADKCGCVFLHTCHAEFWGSYVTRLRHCATSRKVAGSIPNGVIGILH